MPNNEPYLEVVTLGQGDTERLGEEIGRISTPGGVYLMVGSLGAGKTALVRGIARGLGITSRISSPSFVLIKEFKGRLPLYHMDLYRLRGRDELATLGLEDYIYGNGVCAIEWADRAPELFSTENLTIRLGYLPEFGDEYRSVLFYPSSSRYQELVRQIQALRGVSRER